MQRNYKDKHEDIDDNMVNIEKSWYKIGMQNEADKRKKQSREYHAF